MARRVATHAEFAERVGITLGMASRLHNGRRAASRTMLNRIIKAFNLKGEERQRAINAWLAGPEAFGAYLQRTLYEQKVA